MTAARSSVTIAAATWGGAAVEPVVAAGQVGLVGARAVVVGAARVDREARAPWPAASAARSPGSSRPLTCGANAADPWPTSSAAAREPSASSAPRPSRTADLVERAEHRVRVAEAQPRRVEEAALGALHRPRDRAAGRDRVDAVRVAAPAGLEDGVRVRDAAQRPEREDVLVLDPGLLPAGPLVDVLAADRARSAAVAGDAARLGELLCGQARGVGERRGLEVAGRERGDRVEGEQVRERAELAVLRRRRAERALPQVAGSGEDRLRIGGRDLRRRHARRPP